MIAATTSRGEVQWAPWLWWIAGNRSGPGDDRSAGRYSRDQQVRLLGLVLLGRDRAAVAQVGQAGERPGDLVRVASAEPTAERLRRPPTATLPSAIGRRGIAGSRPGPAGRPARRRPGAAAWAPSRRAPCRPRTRASRRASLLEHDRAADHPHRVDAALGRGQDGQVAEVEHPPEDRLVRTASLIFSSELSVDVAVEHALDLDDPSIGQHVLLVDVAQDRPDGDRDATEEQDRGDPAEHVRQRPAGAIRAEPAAEPEQQDRDDDGEDRVAGAPDEDERMLLVAVRDPLPGRQQPVGVAHVAGASLLRLVDGPGCRRPGSVRRSDACRAAWWRYSHARATPGRCAGRLRPRADASRTSGAGCAG